MSRLALFAALSLGASLAAQDPNYYTPSEIEAAIDQQVALHPTRAKKINLSALPGGSLTHEGRAIWALKVSDNVAADEDEPAIVIASQHHARELNTPVMVIGAMQRLLSGYGSDPALTSIVNGYEVYFVPCVNPDGVNHVWTVYNFWRKNRRNNGGSYGVDLNRNYPFLWGLCGSSTTPSSDIYRGPSAGSEPETQTMRNLIARLRPDVYIDFHSSGQEVLRTYAPCANVSATIANFIERYVDDLRAPMLYQKRSPSASGEAPEDHWASGGTLSFLIEIGTSFQPPYSTTLTEETRVWPGVRRVLTTWRPARRGHVRSSLGNAPLEATITYTPNVFNHGEVTKSRARDGRYGLWLPLGSWNVTFSAPGHQSHTVPVTVSSYDSPVTLDVTLTADCSRYIPDSSASSGASNTIPFGTTAPSELSSTFASNNGGAVGGVVFFDVTPSSSSHLYLHGLDLNTNATVGTDLFVDVYKRSGTYVGHESSMSGWTAWTAGRGTAAGMNLPSRIDFNSGIYLASNTTSGIAVVARNFSHRYTNGSNTYTNADVSWTLGAAANVPFSGMLFSPRTANMTLRYQRDSGTWHNQMYQTILRSAELGPAGEITGLAFVPTTTGRHYNRLLRIRMAHRPAGYTLSTNFGTNISGGTTVLSEVDHVWHTTANTWSEIGLESGFSYDGTSDVVVEIFARGNHMSTGTPAGFRRGNRPRLFAYGWPWSSPPTTGTLDGNAGKIRVEFACANSGYFGTSCGPARADTVGLPLAGSTYRLDIHDGAPNSGAIVVIGLTHVATDLTNSGFTNCSSWNDNIASVFKVTSASGFAFHNIAIPNTTAFNGLKLYGYWANLDPSQPGGLSFTNGVRGVVGSQTP